MIVIFVDVIRYFIWMVNTLIYIVSRGEFSTNIMFALGKKGYHVEFVQQVFSFFRYSRILVSDIYQTCTVSLNPLKVVSAHHFLHSELLSIYTGSSYRLLYVFFPHRSMLHTPRPELIGLQAVLLWPSLSADSTAVNALLQRSTTLQRS